MLLLTGNPGVGKTTVILKTINILKTNGVVIGGVASKEIRKNKTRVGFELIDLGTDARGVLASSELSLGPRLGRYRVNLKDLAEVAAKALEIGIQYAELVVCDEIGPMEMFSPEFRRAVKSMMSSNKPVLGTVHKYTKDPIVEEIKSHPRTTLIEVDLENRELLPEGIVKEFTS